MLHTDWHLGPHFRAFVQLKSGLESSRTGGPRPIDEKKLDFEDAFFEAFWRRPEKLLDASIRRAQSVWALLDPGLEEQIVARLARALESGAWDAEHGYLRAMESFDGSLRLLISEGARAR